LALTAHAGRRGAARKALGIALILYGLLGVSRLHLQVPPRAEPWLGPTMGAANGAVSTATGVFMFPVIPYIQSLGLDRDDLVQAQGISFTVSTLALTIVLLGSGTLNATNATGSLLAMAVTFVGMFLGQYARKFIHPEVFRSSSSSAWWRRLYLAFFHRDYRGASPPASHRPHRAGLSRNVDRSAR
jgi:uncharacterized membrane protein YfcA